MSGVGAAPADGAPPREALPGVGFLGVGAIGAPMARRLLSAGHDLIVCDVAAAALRPLAEAGARTTHRPRDCAGEDVVVVMVADDGQLHSCIHGADGLIAGIGAAAPSAILVMSTVPPDSVRDLATAVAPLGIRVFDAPVSGGPLAAEEGRLSVMVGGEPGDVPSVGPILAALASTVHRCGPLGSGALTKILNNLVGVPTLMLLAEALQLAYRSGLDLAQLSAVMEASSGRNACSADWPRARKIYAEFGSDLARVESFMRINTKDLTLALAIAERENVPMPFLRAALKALSCMPSHEVRSRLNSFV